ncbi:hypothetical protein GCM10010376_85500 [Streptomyces violaceusniger]
MELDASADDDGGRVGVAGPAAGVDPAPRRMGPTWREFLTAQAGSIIACDFLHIDLVDLRRVYALVFLEHGTRRLHVAGVTAHPTAQWTAQQARNLALAEGMRLEPLRFLIRDRDSKYPESFDAIFEAEGIETLKTVRGVNIPIRLLSWALPVDDVVLGVPGEDRT